MLPPAAALTVPERNPVRHGDPLALVLVEVDVAVDAARQHEQARGVDRARRRPDVLAERHDAAVPDADVASHRVGRGDDGATPDGEVERHGADVIR